MHPWQRLVPGILIMFSVLRTQGLLHRTTGVMSITNKVSGGKLTECTGRCLEASELGLAGCHGVDNSEQGGLGSIEIFRAPKIPTIWKEENKKQKLLRLYRGKLEMKVANGLTCTVIDKTPTLI